MRRTVIALLLIVSGTAASAVAQTAKQNPPAQGHCAVGVVSHVGDKFKVSKEVFIGKGIYEDVPVESWHIDDLVVDRIRGALGKRAAVQRIPYRKAEIAWFDARPWLGDFLFNAQREDRLRMLATGTRCARYVVVTAGTMHYGDNDNLVGLGIAVRNVLVPRTFVYALITLRVYDGETFAQLRVRTNQFSRVTSTGLVGPTRVVAEAFWPDPPNSAAQNAKLREATRELVAQELDAMLPKLLLTP